MNNFHPVLSSFPLALIFSANLFYFLNLIFLKNNINRAKIFRMLVRPNLFLASIFIALSFLSGYSAKDTASAYFSIPIDLIIIHHYWGRALLMLMLPLLAFEYFESRKPETLQRVLLAIFLITSLILVCISGYLGASLVFKHGAGVEIIVN